MLRLTKSSLNDITWQHFRKRMYHSNKFPRHTVDQKTDRRKLHNCSRTLDMKKNFADNSLFEHPISASLKALFLFSMCIVAM